jgi:hypothetical protein
LRRSGYRSDRRVEARENVRARRSARLRNADYDLVGPACCGGAFLSGWGRLPVAAFAGSEGKRQR